MEKTRNPFSVRSQQRKELCRPGKGADTCRYLVCGPNGFECAKHQDGFRQEIDRRHRAGSMVAKGDNCEGVRGENVQVH